MIVKCIARRRERDGRMKRGGAPGLGFTVLCAGEEGIERPDSFGSKTLLFAQGNHPLQLPVSVNSL